MTNHSDHTTRKRRDYWVDLQKLIAQMSESNRAITAPILAQIGNQGMRPNSLYSHGLALLKADRALNGKPFTAATPADLVAVVAYLRAQCAPATATIYAALLRRFWLHMMQTTQPDLDELPASIRRALACKRTRQAFTGQIIPDADLERLVAACATVEPHNAGLPVLERDQEFLRTVRRTGFRASEALACRRNSVTFLEGDLVSIGLPHDAPDLKTGPRTVIFSDPAGTLRRWVEVIHPVKTPDAPLFPTMHPSKLHLPVAYKTMDHLMRRLQNATGIKGKLGHYSLHDLRHTCATEKAKLRWSEEQMRRYFGWAPGSSMPSVYIHLDLEDMRAQVAEDAARQAASRTPAAPAPDMAATMAAAVADAITRALRGDGASPAPLITGGAPPAAPTAAAVAA